MKFGYVSLFGRSNTGKSTLLNRIIGEKLAIVSDKPQTTRTRILGVKNYPDGQVVFLDTPGLHRPLHRMNVQMVDAALETLQQVDVLLVVVDASQRTGRGDRFVLNVLKRTSVPVVLALNKIDLISKPTLLPLIDWYRMQHAFVAIVPISALTGEGVEALERVVIERVPEGQPLYPVDYLTDQPERFLAAEMVREPLLRYTRDELPFASAVAIDRFEDRREEGVIVIHASILVEQESQKGIVVGRGGTMIKRIGTDARQELERFFGTRVFLDLHVKARSHWRESARHLRDLGLDGDT